MISEKVDKHNNGTSCNPRDLLNLFEDGHGQLCQSPAVPGWIVWIWQDWSECLSKRACATIFAVRQLLLLRLMYKVLSRAETVAASIQRDDLDLYQTQMKLQQLKADVAAKRCDSAICGQTSQEKLASWRWKNQNFSDKEAVLARPVSRLSHKFRPT